MSDDQSAMARNAPDTPRTADAARWTGAISRGEIDKSLETLYGNGAIEEARNRLYALIEEFGRRFSTERKFLIVSAPGRTELGGNHTDHNNGRVLAASVQLDTLALVSPRTDNRATMWSQGFDAPFSADLRSLSVDPRESGSTTALIRGVSAGLSAAGRRIGGFDCCVQSDVLPGSGLSSSASVEVLIGTIQNELWNGGTLGAVELARIGQFAENEYFGKPCGLMDQTACAHGGVIAIDFEDPRAPVITPVSFSFESFGYRLMVINTGGSHADLTDDYAAVPREMREVAVKLGGAVLREIAESDVHANIRMLRQSSGDRALLRTLHYFSDNKRVMMQARALRENRIADYLRLVNDSGDSSWMLLQNCYSPQHPNAQGIPICLAVTRNFLAQRGNAASTENGTNPESTDSVEPELLRGACRVHGGGFAGTVQAYIPLKRESEYRKVMEAIFGPGCVTPLSIRNVGAMAIAAP